jgi:hypothetical protein
LHIIFSEGLFLLVSVAIVATMHENLLDKLLMLLILLLLILCLQSGVVLEDDVDLCVLLDVGFSEGFVEL